MTDRERKKAVETADYKTLDGMKLRDAIRTKCLDCTGYSTTEVKECDTKSCSLWSYRQFGKVQKR